jgi:hypothetical protein
MRQAEGGGETTLNTVGFQASPSTQPTSDLLSLRGVRTLHDEAVFWLAERLLKSQGSLLPSQMQLGFRMDSILKKFYFVLH